MLLQCLKGILFPHLLGHDLTPFMSTKRNFEKHLLVLWNKNWGDSCQWVQKIWHQQEWQPFSFHEKITAWKQLFFVCFRKRKGWTMRRTSKCAICTWAKLVTFLPFRTYRVTNKRAFSTSQWVIPFIHIWNIQIDTFKALNWFNNIKVFFFAMHMKLNFLSCMVIRYSRVHCQKPFEWVSKYDL